MSLITRFRTCISRSLFNGLTTTRPLITGSKYYYSDKADTDKEFKYSESAGAKFRAETHLYGIDPEKKIKEVAPSAILVVRLSFAVLIIYFAVLREENDLDQMLGGSLFETVPQLEEPLLIKAIEAHRLEGKSTDEMEARLEQITKKKANQ